MGMKTRVLPILLLLSCLSEPSGKSGQRVGVDYDGVRLIGGESAALSAWARARDCICDGDPACIDFYDGLSEESCQQVLDKINCGGGPGGGEFIGGAGNEGEAEAEGDWEGEGEAEAEAEAEAEGEDCCDPTDPCEWANDGICDCNGEVDWDCDDCGFPCGAFDGGV